MKWINNQLRHRSTNPSKILGIFRNVVANDDRLLVVEQDVQQLSDVEQAPVTLENKIP